MKQTIKKIIFAVILGLLPVLFIYAAFVALRTTKVYSYVKLKQAGWSNPIFQDDPDLGFRPIPDSTVTHLFPIGPGIPSRFDKNGFRVPFDRKETDLKHPLVLVLGCSFSYGFGCTAEETYAYQLGEMLGGSSINASVPSYGLSQMLIQGQKLIPQYKPDFVVAQYATWLVDRAVRPFGPSYFGKLPTPYFIDQPDGTPGLAPRPFRTKIFDMPIYTYRETPRSGRDYLSFLRRVGFPLLTYDDFHVMGFRIRQAIGRTPKPTDDRDKVVHYVYSELQKTCNDNGARMLVLVLGKDPKPVQPPTSLTDIGIPVINAHDRLIRELKEPTEACFDRTFTHTRGDPPQVVDGHPNPLAHQIMAEELAKAIR